MRIATLNLEQNHKRWDPRRELIVSQLEDLKPDFWALNEIHVPTQTGRWLQRAATDTTGAHYALVQQSKVGEDARTQAEGLLTRLPVIETGNLDYQSHNCVALVARFKIEKSFLDVYVTHLIAAHVPDSARQHQVAQLLAWIRQRNDSDHSIVCGDFNATLQEPSVRSMLEYFRPTQTQPTAFTPLREPGGQPSHPDWPRFDRCIDYIWISKSVNMKASGLCFSTPASDDPQLWPSDHIGVWADIELA